MKIDICNLQRKIKIDRKFIKDSAKKILRILNENETYLSLCFMDDAGIKRLNNRYRHIDRPTDVLAFSMRSICLRPPQLGSGKGLPKGANILGDLVISIQTAKREAKKREKHINEEILLYLVHGILHLLGYSDWTANVRLKMRCKQAEILKKIAEK